MPAEPSLRDRLKQIETNLAEARERRKGAVQERDAAKDAYAATSDVSVDSREFRAAEAAVRKVGAIDDEIAGLQQQQVLTLRLLGEPTPDEDGHAIGNGAPPFGASIGWNAKGLLDDPLLSGRLQQMAAAPADSPIRFGTVPLGQVISKRDMAASITGVPLAADVSGTTNMRRGSFQGVVPQLRRRLSVLDLIPTGTMDNNSFPYVQESGSFTTAAETTEGTTKPEGAITLTDAEAFAATIAVWLKTRRQALADTPALESVIDGRLRYSVLRRLEDQVLAGDGSSPNIRGILNTAGIGTVEFDAGQELADLILTGITQVYLADAESNGIVVHPTDWQSLLSAKAAGDGHYFSSGPFSMTPHVIWGVPLIPSGAVAQGTALVGDFTLGTQLLIREGVNVLLSDSDQDDFIKNRITLLAEMRAALAVFRPLAFSTVALIDPE